MDNEKTSRQRIKARISTSTKLPGIDRVTPPLVTPLVENGASLEKALNNIVGSIGEQNEQISMSELEMSELERAVHVERESLREDINRNRQEVGRSEKRLKERTNMHMAKNLHIANDKRSGTERVTLKRRHGEVKNSERAVSWDSWHKDRCDDGEANSGYHG